MFNITTYPALAPSDSVTGSLLPLTRLKSAGKKAYAVLQADGNFVLYKADGTPLWATGTNGKQVAKVYRVEAPAEKSDLHV